MSAIEIPEFKAPASRSQASSIAFAFVAAWSLLLLPTSAIDALVHIANMKAIVFAPIDSLSELIKLEFPNSPIAALPTSYISGMYVSVLLAGFGWYVWTTSRFYKEKREQLALAIRTYRAATFENQRSEASGMKSSDGSRAGAIAGAATAAAGTASAATIGASALASGAGLGGVAAFAPGLAASGPPGWVILAIAGAAALVGGAIAAVASEDTSKDDARSFSASIDEEREKQLRDAQAAFEQQATALLFQISDHEGRDFERMKVTGAIILLAILWNFIGPYVLAYFR